VERRGPTAEPRSPVGRVCGPRRSPHQTISRPGRVGPVERTSPRRRWKSPESPSKTIYLHAVYRVKVHWTWEAQPHGLRFEPLFASDRMLVVPRDHELAGRKRPTLRDLARHAFVIPPAGARWRREAGCPWAGGAGGHRRLIRHGRRNPREWFCSESRTNARRTRRRSSRGCCWDMARTSPAASSSRQMTRSGSPGFRVAPGAEPFAYSRAPGGEEDGWGVRRTLDVRPMPLSSPWILEIAGGCVSGRRA